VNDRLEYIEKMIRCVSRMLDELSKMDAYLREMLEKEQTTDKPEERHSLAKRKASQTLTKKTISLRELTSGDRIEVEHGNANGRNILPCSALKGFVSEAIHTAEFSSVKVVFDGYPHLVFNLSEHDKIYLLGN